MAIKIIKESNDNNNNKLKANAEKLYALGFKDEYGNVEYTYAYGVKPDKPYVGFFKETPKFNYNISVEGGWYEINVSDGNEDLYYSGDTNYNIDKLIKFYKVMEAYANKYPNKNSLEDYKKVLKLACNKFGFDERATGYFDDDGGPVTVSEF